MMNQGAKPAGHSDPRKYYVCATFILFVGIFLTGSGAMVMGMGGHSTNEMNDFFESNDDFFESQNDFFKSHKDSFESENRSKRIAGPIVLGIGLGMIVLSIAMCFVVRIKGMHAARTHQPTLTGVSGPYVSGMAPPPLNANLAAQPPTGQPLINPTATAGYPPQYGSTMAPAAGMSPASYQYHPASYPAPGPDSEAKPYPPPFEKQPLTDPQPIEPSAPEPPPPYDTITKQ